MTLKIDHISAIIAIIVITIASIYQYKAVKLSEKVNFELAYYTEVKSTFWWMIVAIVSMIMMYILYVDFL